MRLTILVACLGAGWGQVCAQETSLDLRRDGRVIWGARKDYLLQRIKSYTNYLAGIATTRKVLPLKVSDRLRNKLTSSRVHALIIPPGKTGNQYIIGLLIGVETLPEDFAVEASDFNALREFSKNSNFRNVEISYGALLDTMNSGAPASEVTAKINELKATLASSAAEREEMELYAGFLLSDLDRSPEFGKFSDIVAKFRGAVEESLDPVVREAIANNALPPHTALIFGASGDTPTVREVARGYNMLSTWVTRKSSPDASTRYLVVWHKRAPIVVWEKPGMQVDPANPFGSHEYMMVYNPNKPMKSSHSAAGSP